MNLPGMVNMVKGTEIDLGPLGGVEEVRVVDIIKALSLVLHFAGLWLPVLRADGH